MLPAVAFQSSGAHPTAIQITGQSGFNLWARSTGLLTDIPVWLIRVRAIAKHVFGLTQVNWNYDTADWQLEHHKTTAGETLL